MIGQIGNANWWSWQNQAAQGQGSQGQGTQPSSGSSASGANSTGSTSNSISNGTTTASASSFDAFLQSFSTDLQSLLAQNGTVASNGTVAAGSTLASTGTTDPDGQSVGNSRHHHHHQGSGSGDQGGSMQMAANGLVGSIGQVLQGSSIAAGGATQTASTLAGDVMKALSAYAAV